MWLAWKEFRCEYANRDLAKGRSMHHAYIAAVTAKVAADERITAAWLEGSFGRGTPDRYSDLDFHFLLASDTLHHFQATSDSWLSTIQPLVLFTLLFDGRMVNALTRDGLRIDIWLHTEEPPGLDPSKVHILINKGDALAVVRGTPAVHPLALAQALERQTKEFWRCITLLPSVVGRNELITGCLGLGVEAQLLTDIILSGYGIVRDRGVKHLNQFLPTEVRQSLETALSMQGLSPASLTQAHLGLARIMQHHGRSVAEKHRYPYPWELEEAVLRYVAQELALLGLHQGNNQ